MALDKNALLAIAHFKFTHDFRRKIELALALQSYAKASKKYSYYYALLERIDETGGTFLGKNSVIYRGPQQLSECGLLKWPFIKDS